MKKIKMDLTYYIVGGLSALTGFYAYVILKKANKFLDEADERQKQISKNSLESIVKRIHLNPYDNYLSYIDNQTGKIIFH